MTDMETKDIPSITFPAWIRHANDLSYGARILLGEINDWCRHHKNYCFTNRQIAEAYDVTETTVSIWVSELVKKGYIEREIVMGSYQRRRILTIKCGEGKNVN